MVVARVFAILVAVFLIVGVHPTSAATITVGPGELIQDAIESADAGDTIQVAAGTYEERLDFLGKAVSVVGSGPDTVIRASGAGPVVTFASGEGPASELDSVTITGGNAVSGGGILIVASSPTIVRTVIIDNIASSRGSGIYIEGGPAAPLIANNLIVYNSRDGFADPHAVQTDGSSPLIVNNTIAANDSNGVFVSGGGSATVLNNLLARNGTRGSASIARRGRGICNFDDDTVIDHNLFFRNAKAALLQGGRDFRKVRRAQLIIASPRLVGNTDGSPKFARRRLARMPSGVLASDFELRPKSRAIAAGSPDSAYDNLDGTRNTVGHTGGPLAALP